MLCSPLIAAVCLEEAGLSGSPADPPIRLQFETVKFCNSMWFQFDPSPECPHSSLLMSNGASAIIPCVIRVTTDYVSAGLPTKWEVVGWITQRHFLARWPVPRRGLFVCAACGGIHHFPRAITPRIEFPCHIFAKLPLSLVHSRHSPPVRLSYCGADSCSHSSNILSFKKAVGESLQAGGSTQGCSPSITPVPLSPAAPLPSAASLEIHSERIFAR